MQTPAPSHHLLQSSRYLQALLSLGKCQALGSFCVPSRVQPGEARPPLPSLTPLSQRAEALECSKPGPLDALCQMQSHFWHYGTTRDWVCNAHPWGRASHWEWLISCLSLEMIASSMTELISIPTLIPLGSESWMFCAGMAFTCTSWWYAFPYRLQNYAGRIKPSSFSLAEKKPAFLLIPKIAATNGSLQQRSPHVPATSSQNSTDDGNMGPKKQNLFSSPCVFADDWKNRLKRMPNSAKLWMAWNEQFLAQAVNSRSDSCKLG